MTALFENPSGTRVTVPGQDRTEPTPAGRHRRVAPVLLGGRGGRLAGEEHDLAARMLQVLAVLTVGLASVEGYLLQYGTVLTKLPAALLLAAWVWVRVRERRLPRFHRLHGALALLAVVVLASAAVHNQDTFTSVYLVRWVSFLLVTVVLMDVAAREVPVRLVLGAAVAGALVAAGGALYSFVGLGDARATGPLEDPNDLAYVLVAALPLLVALRPRSSRHARGTVLGVVAALAAVPLVLGMAVTVSRGGALALVAILAWLGLRRAVSGRVMAAVGGAAVLGLLAAVVAFGPLVATAIGQKETIGASNVDTRALRWEVALRMLPDAPLVGVGPGGFRGNYYAYSGNAELAELTPVAHNMYVEVAAELGLLGFAGFVAVIAVGLLAAERAARNPATRTTALAVQASLIGVLVASAFLSEQYYMPLWSMIAVACALDLRSRHRLKQVPS